MSFSSKISGASGGSTTSASTAPSSPPHQHSQPETQTPLNSDTTPQQAKKINYKTFESLLLESVNLARSAFTRHWSFGINTPTARYLFLHERINKFLAKYRDFDFVSDGTYRHVLQIKILFNLTETALGQGHQEMVGLKCEEQVEADAKDGGNEKMQALKNKCYRDVDYLVLWGWDLNVAKLPWNLKNRGETQKEE